VPGHVTLSDCGKPFDESLFPGMPLADLSKAAMKFLGRALFLGGRLEIGEQGRRLVVAGRAAALDFCVDLSKALR
jgi:hypothetical protein